MIRTEQSVEMWDAGLTQQAHEFVDAATRLYGPDFRLASSTDIHGALEGARRQLGDALTEGRLSDSDIEEACHVLVGMEELEELGAESDAIRRVGELNSLHTAVVGLRDLAPAEMVQVVPSVICSALPFTRAMLSAINGSSWQPQRLHVQPQYRDSWMDFSGYVDSATFSLAEAQLEGELVRRRVPALVLTPEEDDRTLKSIVQASRSSAYVAAPIVSRGKVIGLFHADRPGGDGRLEPDDRDRLDAFATFFGLVFEQAVLRERISVQRSRLVASFDATDAQLERMQKVDGGLRRTPESGCPSSQQIVEAVSGGGAHEGLTSRERDVLAHMATGATNSQIAQMLVISEGTVKSHVKSILRKLRVSTRAAAAALYARQGR
ncbi:LuxR C-terminal-related transcriptional regulator [Rhodococcus erythropolis]|uniref:LuxR C-terminal-related transcriptional regulator n=1 Tax=Rhodococcus erythropolis TaxID=1833 RepID=A0AAX3ZY69_RHOER|nr:LuxR C-terminal-related transcriptional regulator [Rhodococcus erythropolis]WMN01696.1 LuxR C-terminal-related transcriptional regulator [Rhodococcus erythropolis]